MPIIVYNVPSRTGVNIEPKTLYKIAQINNICGVKEASGNISQISQCFALVGNCIAIYSGDDNLNFVFYALGGCGCVSVAANLYPKAEKQLFCLANNDPSSAKILNNQLYPLHSALFIEPNPVPLKYALSKLDIGYNEVCPPLLPLDNKKNKIVDKIMEGLDKLL